MDNDGKPSDLGIPNSTPSTEMSLAAPDAQTGDQSKTEQSQGESQTESSNPPTSEQIQLQGDAYNDQGQLVAVDTPPVPGTEPPVTEPISSVPPSTEPQVSLEGDVYTSDGSLVSIPKNETATSATVGQVEQNLPVTGSGTMVGGSILAATMITAGAAAHRIARRS